VSCVLRLAVPRAPSTGPCANLLGRLGDLCLLTAAPRRAAEELIGQHATALARDLACKRSVLLDMQELCSPGRHRLRAGGRDDLLVYLSVWTEQPFVEASQQLTIEAVLLGEV
jgi:hypothetical protein